MRSRTCWDRRRALLFGALAVPLFAACGAEFENEQRATQSQPERPHNANSGYRYADHSVMGFLGSDNGTGIRQLPLGCEAKLHKRSRAWTAPAKHCECIPNQRGGCRLSLAWRALYGHAPSGYHGYRFSLWKDDQRVDDDWSGAQTFTVGSQGATFRLVGHDLSDSVLLALVVRPADGIRVHVESASASGRLSGWALDAHATQDPVRVEAYVDSAATAAASARADARRLDVANHFGIRSRSSNRFGFTLSLPDGPYFDGQRHSLRLVVRSGAGDRQTTLMQQVVLEDRKGRPVETSQPTAGSRAPVPTPAGNLAPGPDYRLTVVNGRPGLMGSVDGGRSWINLDFDGSPWRHRGSTWWFDDFGPYLNAAACVRYEMQWQNPGGQPSAILTISCGKGRCETGACTL